MENLHKLRFFAFDSDGVLFSNTDIMGLAFGGEVCKPKFRTHYDGQAVSFLRAIGIRVCIITAAHGADSAPVKVLVDRWNNLPSARKSEVEGGWKHVELFEDCEGPQKLVAITKWLDKHGGNFAECAAMGNDLGDAHMLRAVAFPFASGCAAQEIKSLARFVATRDGGQGAVRDVVDMILKARGVDVFSLPTR